MCFYISVVQLCKSVALGKCMAVPNKPHHPSPANYSETTISIERGLPSLAFKNFSVMSWIFGSGAQMGCLIACLSGRLVCGVTCTWEGPVHVNNRNARYEEAVLPAPS